VALLFEREERLRSRELALHQRHLVAPRMRNQLNVLEIPVVVVDADAGRTGLRRGLGVEPRRKGVGGVLRALDVAFARTGHVGDARRQRGEIRALLPDAFRAVDPEIAAISGQVALRLIEKLRDRTNAAADFSSALGCEGKRVAPELDGA